MQTEHRMAGARAIRGVQRFRERPRWSTVLTRLTAAFVGLWAASALWSGYRAVVQVFRLELAPPGGVVRVGSALRADVVTSGRARATVRLELVQGTRAETLGTLVVRGNRDGALDPRPRRATLAVTLDPATAGRLAAGPAVLRAVATGTSQWLRTPPPTVREVPVILEREAGPAGDRGAPRDGR
jgi:hypothetical protein